MVDMSINQNQQIPQQIPQQRPVNSIQNILNKQQNHNQQVRETNSQSDLIQLLVQQQKVFQEEIMKLSKGMTQLQSMNDTNRQYLPQSPQSINEDNGRTQQIPSDFAQQFQEKVNELEQYKIINVKMQERIIDLQNQLQNANQTNNTQSNDQSSDPKIKQLNKVKQETMEQIEKLKKTQEDISIKLTLNKDLETKIKKVILDNTSKFENSEESYFINSSEMTLPESVKSVTSIELTNFDLPFDKYNITTNNNTLQFIMSQDLIGNLMSSFSMNDLLDGDKEDSDTANAIDSDQESLIESDFDSDTNMLTLKLFMGNYSIDKLIQLLNQSLLKYKIKVVHNSSTNLITIKSNDKQNFDLYFGENTLFNNLGFIGQNMSNASTNKYSNQSKYLGSKVCDLKFDKYINIYLTNVNSSKPVMQYILGQQNQNKKMVFSPVITELNKLEFKFIDSKGREFKFDSDNGLDWSMQAIIKSIVPINNVLNNELSDALSSDDVYNLVSLNVKEETKSEKTNKSDKLDKTDKKKQKNSVQFVDN